MSKNKFRHTRASFTRSLQALPVSFLATSNFALGSTITAHGGATSVTSIGNRIKVETTQKSGSNAFNSFSAFNLSSGDIVNMHLPAATNNLINFVSSRITIDGTLNAIKNNKIGGNLFFLSSQGLVVGSGGVVNCGAFYAMTPTKDFMERFVKTDVLLLAGNEAEIGYITSRKFVNHNGVKDGAGVPLATYNPVNEDGSIVVNGKISATDNIGLYAGKVALNSGVNAKLTTGVTDFSALVNIADIPGVAVAGLTMTSTSDGNVELVAVADNVGRFATISKLATGFSSFTEASSVAKVTVNGTINAKRNATIEAVAVNGNLNGTQTVVEYGETKEVEKYKNANYLSDIQATVEFGNNARVYADNDIIVNAIARNIYKTSTGNLVDIGLSIAGMTSPVNLAAEVVVADTRAEVKVAQGAVLNAKKDIRIKADSKADVIAGASTAFAKIKQTPGGLSAAAVYAKVNSNADVSINGSLTAGETGDSSKGDINVSAESVNSLDATGAAKTANDNAILSTGVVVANVNNTSKVQISNTAVVKAERTAVIKASTVSDVSTVAIVETGDASYAGMAVNVTEFSSDAAVNVGCNVDAVAGNVDLSAYNLILQNTATAKSSVGYTKISQATANLQSNLASAIMTKLSSKFSGTLGAESGSRFSAAGAIVYAQGKHDANVNIAQNVKLTAGDKLILKSSAKIEDIFFQADSIARSELKKADQTSISVSAGFLYTDIEQNSAVQIADATTNATILTGRTVEINSSTVIEFNRIKRMIQKVKDAVEQLKVSLTDATQLAIINRVSDAYRTMDTQLSAVGAEGLTTGDNLKIVWNALGSLGDVASALSNLVTDEVGVVAQAAKILTSAADFASYNNFLNMSVSSSISGKTGQTSKDFGFAGAAGFNDFVSSSEVIIGRNVTIRSTLPPAVAATTIDISANTNADTISAAGHIIPSSGAKSFGGTFLLQDFRSSAAVTVAEGAILNAAGNDISVSATNNAGTVVAALSTSNACSGIDGMLTRLTGNSNAIINIDDEVAITAKNLKLSSFNNTKVVNVAGSVMITSAVGVAAGVAINDFTRNSIVFAGDIDKSYQDYLDEKSGVAKTTTTDSQVTVTDAKISVLKGVEAQAKSTGKILAIGVAGGIAKNDDSGQAGPVDSLVSAYDGAQNAVVNVINSLGSKFSSDCTKQLSGKTSNSGTGSHKNPEFSLSVAGSSGLNFINSATRVDISGATIDLNGATDSNLNVTALNNSDVMAYAGSVGVMWQSTTQNSAGKSVGIAGAVALNDITNKTEAIIQNSAIVNADKINLYAVNGGSNIAAGLGLQLANNTSSIAAGAYTMGSSVSINNIANTVTTKLKNTTVTGKDSLKTNVNAAAYESDRQITGGVQLTIGKEKGAFGAAVNVANITNNVTAEIDGGTYTKIGNISVSALQALSQVSGALTAGIIWGTPDTVAITGAMIYNRVNNNLNARIKGSANIAAAGTVSVNTKDYRTGNTTSGFEGLLVRSTDSDSFISKDGTDYYNVNASNGIDGTVTPTNIVKNG
ncbi:MAG: surface protein, partial [uncultured bacterium]